MIFYLTAFAAAFHLYVYWKLRAAFGPGRWRLLFFGTFAVFAASLVTRYFEFFVGTRLLEILFALAITEYIVAGMLCCVLVLTEILKIFLCLWDKVKKTRLEDRVTPRRAAFFALGVVFCVAAYGYYEACNVKEVHIVIPSDKLPEGSQGIRIVQISDIHIGGIYPAWHLERVMAMVRAAKPDIFVVTGDLVDGNMAHRSKEAELVANNGAKYGAFAIVGNHEYYAGFEQALEFIERCGLTLLYDEMAEAAGIVVIGLDDLSEIWTLNLHTPKDRFVLLLKHHPNVMKTSRGKFDLQLSGHTHGGQLWPLGCMQEKSKGHVQGLSKDKESSAYVYVSNGTGYWTAPLRIFAPPEVTVIDLVRP